jgi:hypothetical protein
MADLKSCDTFVALPPATGNGCVVFGKNSDRPGNEVQEVVFRPAAKYDAGTKLQVKLNCHGASFILFFRPFDFFHASFIHLSEKAFIW